VDVRKIGDDTWVQSTVTYNTRPATAGSAGTFKLTKDQPGMEVDITGYVAAEFAGDKIVSMELYASTGSNGAGINNPTLQITYTYDTGVTKEDVGHIPRAVRIIPYLRKRNPSTGGFSWLLDQDESNLKTLELPRNIHYVLQPQLRVVPQYDPGDIVDQQSSAKKIWFDLWPDGSCTAAPPDVEGWTNRVNTIILHDAVTNDLALLFVPPASAFTRQRFLFGDEVDAFIAAHSLYSLW
jgi:hypothetical protein